MASIPRDDLEALAIDLANAKAAEEAAKNVRLECEAKLAEALGGKEDGSQSYTCGRLKVTLKRGWNYKADVEWFAANGHGDLLKTKTEFVGSAYEKLRDSDPGLFRELAGHVVATPKKASVELKL